LILATTLITEAKRVNETLASSRIRDLNNAGPGTALLVPFRPICLKKNKNRNKPKQKVTENEQLSYTRTSKNVLLEKLTEVKLVIKTTEFYRSVCWSH
jgi:hypothetical protein